MFVHLHNHFLIDSAIRYKKAIEKVKNNNQPGLAITDHNAISLHIKFYKECLKNNIKPILGCEFYFVDDALKYFNSDSEIGEREHIIILAKNKTGLKNLYNIQNYSKLNYRLKEKVSLIDWDLLEKYKEGLIVTNACVFGVIANPIMKNNDVYKKRIEKFLKLFGEDFYFEIGYHYFPDQRFVNEKIIKLAESYNRIPIIVNDSHYLEKEDWYVQTVLFKKIFNIRREYSAETQDSYLKTEQEMELLGYKREFLDKTMEVFNKVEIVNPLDVIKGSKSKKEICLSGKIHTLTAKEALDYGAFYFNKENAVANRFQDKSVSLSEYYNSDKNIKEFLDSNPLISEAAFKLEGVTTNIVPDFENIVLADDNLPCNLFAGKLKFSQFDNEDIAEVYEIKNIEIYKIYFDNAVKIKNFTEAIDFYEKDVFDTAIPKFENFLADKEYEIEANFYLGNCYYFKNQMYKAIDFYEKIMDSDLELDKKYLLYYFYGWCCYRVLKNQEKALEYMEKAIDLASFKPTAYYGAGLINYYMKNDKAAKEYFESFLKYSKNQNKKNKVNEILLKIENYLKRG